jgi:hypothetical protein
VDPLLGEGLGALHTLCIQQVTREEHKERQLAGELVQPAAGEVPLTVGQWVYRCSGVRTQYAEWDTGA